MFKAFRKKCKGGVGQLYINLKNEEKPQSHWFDWKKKFEYERRPTSQKEYRFIGR